MMEDKRSRIDKSVNEAAKVIVMSYGFEGWEHALGKSLNMVVFETKMSIREQVIKKRKNQIHVPRKTSLFNMLKTNNDAEYNRAIDDILKLL